MNLQQKQWRDNYIQKHKFCTAKGEGNVTALVELMVYAFKYNLKKDPTNSVSNFCLPSNYNLVEHKNWAHPNTKWILTLFSSILS